MYFLITRMITRSSTSFQTWTAFTSWYWRWFSIGTYLQVQSTSDFVAVPIAFACFQRRTAFTSWYGCPCSIGTNFEVPCAKHTIAVRATSARFQRWTAFTPWHWSWSSIWTTFQVQGTTNPTTIDSRRYSKNEMFKRNNSRDFL